MLADIAADRKLIARYIAAVESHEDALQALRSTRNTPEADEASLQAFRDDVTAASARAGAFLTILEDRAARFFGHPDFQPYWRPA